MPDEDTDRILRSIGEILRADMKGLTDELPPNSILLQVLHLIRREQALCGAERLSCDKLPENLRLLLEQCRPKCP